GGSGRRWSRSLAGCAQPSVSSRGVGRTDRVGEDVDGGRRFGVVGRVGVGGSSAIASVLVIERSQVSTVGEGSSRTVLVSACLLGVRCNHLGASNTSPAVVALGERYHLMPVCPETVGGLPTPRPAP